MFCDFCLFKTVDNLNAYPCSVPSLRDTSVSFFSSKANILTSGLKLRFFRSTQSNSSDKSRKFMDRIFYLQNKYNQQT